jgi:glycosyltransferase involved in cell wall biosynthesis
MEGISVVLGSFNRKRFLVKTIESVRKSCLDLDYEIIVIDGGSNDGSLNWLNRQKDIITIVQHNRGVFNGKPIKRKSWGYFMNLGFKSAQYKYILMISDDCLLHLNSVKNGLNKFIELENNSVNIGAMPFFWRNWPEQIEYVVGYSYGKLFLNHGIYLKSALEAVNFADEKSYNFYYGDGDLSLRLWQHGYCLVESENSFLEHFTHANQNVRLSNLERERSDFFNYDSRWNGYFSGKDIVDYDWKKIDYNDPFKTYKQFPILPLMIFFFKNNLIKLKLIIKQKIQ